MRPLKIMKLLNNGASIVISVLDWPVNIRSLSSVISEISIIDLLRSPSVVSCKSKRIPKFLGKRKTLFRGDRLKIGVMAFEVLNRSREVVKMTCPGCNCESEMAYSALSHGFVCLEQNCGFEFEMDPVEAMQVLEFEDELVCC